MSLDMDKLSIVAKSLLKTENVRQAKGQIGKQLQNKTSRLQINRQKEGQMLK